MPSVHTCANNAIAELAHSRELATLRAYSAVLAPHGRLLALELPRGSHVARYFTAITYDQCHVSPQIDYEALDDIASAYSPGFISASFPSFSRLID